MPLFLLGAAQADLAAALGRQVAAVELVGAQAPHPDPVGAQDLQVVQAELSVGQVHLARAALIDPSGTATILTWTALAETFLAAPSVPTLHAVAPSRKLPCPPEAAQVVLVAALDLLEAVVDRAGALEARQVDLAEVAQAHQAARAGLFEGQARLAHVALIDHSGTATTPILTAPGETFLEARLAQRSLAALLSRKLPRHLQADAQATRKAAPEVHMGLHRVVSLGRKTSAHPQTSPATLRDLWGLQADLLVVEVLQLVAAR